MLDELHIVPIKYTLADEIVRRLTHAIMSGHLGPGERLNDDVIARNLDVSRGPVREAFRQLERQGLIVTRRNRGSYVARLQRQDVEEVYSMRLVLECLALERAAQFGQSSHFVAMQAVVDTMAASDAHTMTEQKAAELDLQFHDLIYSASNHKRLNECWMNLRPQVQIVFLTRNAANPDFRELNPLVHQALLDALRERDTEKVLALATHNMRMSYEHALRHYPE